MRSEVEGRETGPVRAVYGVAGMSCEHCVAAVTEEVDRIAGVRGVQVELFPGGVSKVTVTSATVLDQATVAAAVDEAGYELAALPL